MNTTMEFEQNAGVVTASGQEVGHIDRVVVDPETRAITHIVVRKGFLLTHDKVVPIELVEDATEQQITLREDAGDLDALPPFEETHYVLADEDAQNEPPPVEYMPSAYGLGSPLAMPANRYIQKTEQNIPEGSVALKEGAKVVSAEGKYVGNVERVVTDAPTDKATHLLVSKGRIAKVKKLIPINWVMGLSEEKVRLRVEQETIEELSSVTTEK